MFPALGDLICHVDPLPGATNLEKFTAETDVAHQHFVHHGQRDAALAAARAADPDPATPENRLDMLSVGQDHHIRKKVQLEHSLAHSLLGVEGDETLSRAENPECLQERRLSMN